ncbi:MAG: hypothetical protein V4710_24595 [Verrucomicrobiota bacterium]
MKALNPLPKRPALRFRWQRIGLFFFFSLSALFLLVADRRSGPILATLTGIVCLLLVILPPIRIAGRIISPLLTAPIVWLAGIVAGELALPPRCSVHSIARDTAPMIIQLDEYRRVHGHYPASLEAEDITPPRYRGDAFTYTLDADGSCGLMIGAYHLDGFSAIWDSTEREWHTDT